MTRDSLRGLAIAFALPILPACHSRSSVEATPTPTPPARVTIASPSPAPTSASSPSASPSAGVALERFHLVVTQFGSPSQLVLRGYVAKVGESFGLLTPQGPRGATAALRIANPDLELWYTRSGGEPGTTGPIAVLDSRGALEEECERGDDYGCVAIHGALPDPARLGSVESMNDADLARDLAGHVTPGSRYHVKNVDLWRLHLPAAKGPGPVFGRVQICPDSGGCGNGICSNRWEGFLLDGSPARRVLDHRVGWQAILSVTDLDGDGVYEVVTEMSPPPQQCSHEFRAEPFDGTRFLDGAVMLAGYVED